MVVGRINYTPPQIALASPVEGQLQKVDHGIGHRHKYTAGGLLRGIQCRLGLVICLLLAKGYRGVCVRRPTRQAGSGTRRAHQNRRSGCCPVRRGLKK